MTQNKKKLTVAFVGNESSGKSSLLGHIAQALGKISSARMKTVEQQAAKRDKRSAKFAMAFDREPEWDSGHTTECKITYIDTSNTTLIAINVPGLPEHQHEVVSALSGADAVVLVVDATSDAFAAGMAKQGQTREHALLAYSLGIRQAVVAINKLDTFALSAVKKRYDECKAEVARYLKRVGFNQVERVTVVPVSATMGENLSAPSSSWTWYKGPSLVEAIESLDPQERPSAAPLRVAVFGVQQKEQHVLYIGRVEYGTMRIGMALSFMPWGATADLKLLEANGAGTQAAFPGDLVAFSVNKELSLDNNLECMVSDADHSPCRLAASFVGQVIQLNSAVQLNTDSEVRLEICTASVTCRVVKVLQKIDRRSGKIIEEDPEMLSAGEVAFCKFEPLNPVVIESCTDFMMLGRFCIRHEKHVVAVGLVKSVEYEKKPKG